MSNAWTTETSGPTGPERIVAGLARIRGPVGWLAIACLAVSAWMIFCYAPIEVMGEVQKIYYVHVPSWWTAFLGVTTVFLASGLLLLTRDRVWDEIAGAAAEVAVLFLTIGIVTGSVNGMKSSPRTSSLPGAAGSLAATNCGRKVMKNRMIFGLSKLMPRPVAQCSKRVRCLPPVFSGENAEPLRIAWKASQTR